jgi:hypothetical protein
MGLGLRVVMKIFARIEQHVVAQLVTLPEGLTPSGVYTPSLAASFIDVTDRDPTPQIGWLHYQDGSFGPAVPLTPELPADEVRSRAIYLLFSCDPVIEHFYEHFLPVPAEWTAYRAALRLIAISGIVPADGGPERPACPTFSFRRDGRLPPPLSEGHALAA